MLFRSHRGGSSRAIGGPNDSSRGRELHLPRGRAPLAAPGQRLAGRPLAQHKEALLLASNAFRGKLRFLEPDPLRQNASFLSFGPTQGLKLPKEVTNFIDKMTGPPSQEPRPKDKSEPIIIISEGITRLIERTLNAGKPLTPDDRWILMSWFMLGTTFWIIVWSTSILGLILWAVQPLFIQGLFDLSHSSLLQVFLLLLLLVLVISSHLISLFTFVSFDCRVDRNGCWKLCQLCHRSIHLF